MTDIFSTIQLTWRERNTVDTLTVHNSTLEDALQRAEFFGYVEPKWYQFWRTKIEIDTIA